MAVKSIDLQMVLDSVYNGIVACDTDGRIILINESAARVAGQPKDKLMGARVDQVFPNTGLLEVIRTGENRPHQRLNFQGRLLLSNRSPIRNADGELVGAIGVFQDNSELESMTHAFKEEKKVAEELQDIIESSYDGMWITDGQGYTLHVNSAYERISGMKKEEVLGKHMQELVDKGYFSDSVTLHVLEKKERVTMMHEIRKTGKRALITGNPIFDENGQIVRVVTNVRDITELLNLKQDLEDKAKQAARYQNELAQLRSQSIYDDIVVESPQMRHIFDLATWVGQVDSTVLILGESGVGKEVVTQIVVRSSERRDEPFIKVNCGAIPENLLESELFGYEKGSFTGADKKGKPGMFELAHKGTILLDEVAEIPLNLQVKLLRAIQEQEIIRVGGTKPMKLDVRIIAATNRDLDELVRTGQFREDLFYRLNVIPITVPPLRERREDIPALIELFLCKYNEKYRLIKTLAPETVERLVSYDWPGNVRELQNIVERMVVLSRDDEVGPDALPLQLKSVGKTDADFHVDVSGVVPLKDALFEVEKKLVVKALQKYGTTRRAAEALGVDQSTVVRKYQRIRELEAGM
ncbi:sigma-54 interaction domain-containing protein [Dethiobacter alkaliphilus]|uniref:sigma-54 interaction domain-containing protein n=1 Tax=Dethiobacter alkaliphilus TaxID=427926 RepID=UPI002226D7D7|nr:sigma 54-interacting transcriptional regulator [Dethiobacter alkaliphilus]MCW3488785.1 sigma 54-interacting transcriptional regulator [Dethiobacter alkaliphilus]